MLLCYVTYCYVTLRYIILYCIVYIVYLLNVSGTLVAILREVHYKNFTNVKYYF